MSGEQPVVRNPGATWRRTSTGLVALGPWPAEPVVLSSTAALVWEQLGDYATESEQTQLLVDVFEVAEDVARQDVRAAIREMRRVGLLLDAAG